MIDDDDLTAEELDGYVALGDLVENCLNLEGGVAAAWAVCAARRRSQVRFPARRRHAVSGAAVAAVAAVADPPPPPVMDEGSPVVRIVLGTQLRRLREAAGFSRLRAGAAIGATPAKIGRLELGRGALKRHDLEDLLTLYGVTDPRERAAHLDLAAPTTGATWWWQHDSYLLPRGFELYLRLEQVASHIRAYQLQVVPDLLQSEDYAHQLVATTPGTDPDRHVHQLAIRQRRLTEPGAPQFWAVVDEGALRRSFGPPAVLRSQLRHVLELTELPNVTVQMLPFTAGGRFVTAGPFTVLRFTEPDLPDVVYRENLDSAVYVEKRSDVENYHDAINRASVQALTPAESRARIHAMVASG